MSPDMVGFLAVVMVAYLIPGPDFLIIAHSATRSRAAGLGAGLGAQTGLCAHMLVAVVGLSALAVQSALAFSIVKLSGAIYLVWLGARVAWSSRSTGAPRTTGGQPVPATQDGTAGRWTGFRRGLVTNLLNPKAALFFLSVLPQFIDTSAPTAPQILLLGVIDVVVGVLWWCLIVVLMRRIAGQLDRPRVRAWWNRVTGILLLGAGTGLAISAS